MVLAQAHILPIATFFNPDFLPQSAFEHFLLQLSRGSNAKSAHSEFSVSLWSAQQSLSEALSKTYGTYLPYIPCAITGLPPLSPRALEGYFQPSGRFWLGLFLHGNPSDLSEQTTGALVRLLGPHVRSTRIQPVPWIPEMSSSGGWALGANHCFADQIELMGISPRKR